jgi:hypothetical protein
MASQHIRFAFPHFWGTIAGLIFSCAVASPVAASPISVLDLDAVQLAAVLRADGSPATDDSTRSARAPLGARPGIIDSSLDQLNTNGQMLSAGAPAAAPSAGLLDQGGFQDSGGSLKSGTLGHVLQSIITWQRSDQPQRAPRLTNSAQTNDGRGGTSDDELGVDLRRLILDSEISGSMLRAIVDIKSSDNHGSRFSVFGLGNFAIDVAPDLHAAIVSELSSGMAFRMSLSGERLGYDRYPEAALSGGALAGMPHENVNLIRVIWKWALDMLYSPVGALLSMSAAITLILWICVKSVVFLQRRASRY